MLALCRTRRPDVSLRDASSVSMDIMDTHWAVIQSVDGPAELGLPPCSGAHFLAAGALQISHRQQLIAVAPGSLLVSEGSDRPLLRVPAQAYAVIVHLFLAPSWLHTDWPHRRGDLGLLPILHDAGSRSAAAMDRFAKAVIGLTPDQQMSSLDLNAHLNDLLASSAEHRPSIDRCPGHSQRHRREVFIRMKWARDLILHGLERSLSVNELAHYANLSPSHFTRQFRRIFGMPPNRYRLKQQMAQAHALLRERRLSVGEVMMRVGLDNPCSFARAFKREFGRTPSEVRTLARGVDVRDRFGRGTVGAGAHRPAASPFALR
jgi:AraC-like DNA-binding protein